MLITATPRPDIALTILQDQIDVSQFIAPDVLPIFDAKVSTAPIPRILRSSKIERLKRARYGKFVRSQVEAVSAGTFNCVEEGYEEPYDAKDIEIYGGEAAAQAALGKVALNKILIAHEFSVQSTLMNTSNFTAAYQQAAAAVWGSGTDKPLDDIQAANDVLLKNCGMEGNVLVIGQAVYTKLKKSAQIQNQIRAIMGYTNATKGVQVKVTAELLALALGLEKVLIGRGRYNSADEGQADSMGFIWPSNYAFLMYQPPADDQVAAHLGRTFVWDPGLMDWDVDGTQIATPYRGAVLEQYYENGSNIGVMRARKFLDTLLLNKESGALITGV